MEMERRFPYSCAQQRRASSDIESVAPRRLIYLRCPCQLLQVSGAPARRHEDQIQLRIQPLPLGLRRLHIYIGKGQKFPDKLGVARCHKVFITTSANFNSPQLFLNLKNVLDYNSPTLGQCVYPHPALQSI